MSLVQDRPVDFAAARRAMIDSQLRVSGVNDPAILAAFGAIAREDYVPAARRAVAYADRAVLLDDGGVLAPALTYGQMLTAAAPATDDTVLVIGRNGYLAALAGRLAGRVALVAPDESLPAGPFSLVLIDGAAEVLPDALGALVAPHGRIVTGLVERGVTRLAIGRPVAGQAAPVFTALGDVDFAPLPEFAAKPGWSF